MCVFLFDVLNGCSLVNKYIGKRMSKLCFLETLTLLKRGAKVNFLEKKNLKIYTSFEVQKCTMYIQGNILFGIILFSCPLSKTL